MTRADTLPLNTLSLSLSLRLSIHSPSPASSPLLATLSIAPCWTSCWSFGIWPAIWHFDCMFIAVLLALLVIPHAPSCSSSSSSWVAASCASCHCSYCKNCSAFVILAISHTLNTIRASVEALFFVYQFRITSIAFSSAVLRGHLTWFYCSPSPSQEYHTHAAISVTLCYMSSGG